MGPQPLRASCPATVCTCQISWLRAVADTNLHHKTPARPKKKSRSCGGEGTWVGRLFFSCNGAYVHFASALKRACDCHKSHCISAVSFPGKLPYPELPSLVPLVPGRFVMGTPTGQPYRERNCAKIKQHRKMVDSRVPTHHPPP